MKSAVTAPRENVPGNEIFILTPRAAQDVNDVWNYIADDNIEAADRVLDAFYDAMVKLSNNPGIGHWREDLTDKRHRFFLVHSYLIIYRQETKPLQIIRVLHAGRDVQSILRVASDES
jgi:plasmid stabilization system protein ParE